MDLTRAFTFESPNRIVFGVNASKMVAEEAKKLKVSKALLISDEGLKKAGAVDEITSVLEKGGVSYAVFTDVEGNPSTTTVEKALQVYQTEGCDGLIGLGGGSSLDVAKAAGILATNGGSIKSYEGRDKFKSPLPPLLAIPTTCGTGSEATIFVVITDTERKYKMTIVSCLVLPNVAIVDPALLVNLPSRLVAATGIDALTHAIESYTNLAAEPMSDALNIYAIKLIAENLRPAVANASIEALSGMALGSLMAGVAFSNTRVGIAHAMAHPLGGYANVHHGVANAILLPHVMEFNLIGNTQKFVDIAEAMGENVAGLSSMEAARRAVEAVKSLNEDVGVPLTLSEVGVREEMLEPMIGDAMLSGNLQVNPRRTTKEDMMAIFRRAMG